MARHVALLRGINVGAHRRIKMADLKAALATLGYEDVETIGISGNVALTATGRAATIERDIERVIEAECGVEGVLVVVRSARQLAALVEANPWPDRTEHGKLLHVVFLGGDPSAEARAKVEAAVDGDDEVVWGKGCVYVWHARGLMESSVSKLLTDKGLGVTATDRNWNTVAKLHALAGR